MKYQIYQLTDKTHLFDRLSWWEDDKPTRDIYALKYEGEIPDGDVWERLEDLYAMFNTSKPQDFTGHSMSVSDVVGLDGRFFFCDSIGFVELKEGW